jgi:hypothetical protein
MRRQSTLVKIQEGKIQHKSGRAVKVILYTHLNKHRPHAALFRANQGRIAPRLAATPRIVWEWFKGMAKEVGKQYGQKASRAPAAT